jgi:hypothetical protein
MMIDDVAAAFDALDFPPLHEAAPPARQTVLDARAIIEKAIVDDDFLLDCIASELRLIASGVSRWGLVPFAVLPRTGIRLAFGYWPPGGGPGAHEHTAWTITGVCRNELEVRTFDRDESYRRGELVDKNLFAAQQGRVGFIYDAGIHAPRNPSAQWSLSLHLISPHDGQPRPDQPAPIPALTGRAASVFGSVPAAPMLAVQSQKWLRFLASIVAAAATPRSSILLDTVFDLGSTSTRRHLQTLRPASDPPCDRACDAAYRLERSVGELVLTTECHDGRVALCVQTPAGPAPQLSLSDVAREAVGYAADRQAFDVHSLPGPLADDERVAIAEALEETGLFRRVEAR